MKSFVLFLSTISYVLGYLEIAPYEVTKKYEEWEVRRFPPTKWISTDALDVMPHDGPEHSKVENSHQLLMDIKLQIYFD